MKYAILSDIHAYPRALEDALADAKAQGAEKMLCLGDVVGYGPDPVKTVRLVRRACDVTVMGNHDAAVAEVIFPHCFRKEALEGVVRHQQQLSEYAVKWLKKLPYVHEEPDFVCVHGTLTAPERFAYVFCEEDAAESLEKTDKPLTFVGHTHIAATWMLKPGVMFPESGPTETFTLEQGCRYIVNVGSVGYPRRSTCATYCLYDSVLRQVEFRSLPFDIKVYAKELETRNIGIPLWLADRLG